MGCVLEQEQSDETMRPVEYWSQTLNDAEGRYDSTHRECFAVV